MDEKILLESGQLILLPGTAWATTKNVAEFFIVGESTIEMLVTRHRDELASDGYKVMKSKDFRDPHCVGLKSKARFIAIFPRRAVLRIAMLLRDSPVAKLVRTYLLNAESSLQNHDRDTLMKMADQLTEHSIQLKEAAEISIHQSKMIGVVVAEIYKNRDEIRSLQNIVVNHDSRMESFDERLSVLEEWQNSSSVEYISSQQAEILRQKVRSKSKSPTTIWSKFRKHFQITRYVHLPANRFLEAMDWLERNLE